MMDGYWVVLRAHLKADQMVFQMDGCLVVLMAGCLAEMTAVTKIDSMARNVYVK